MASAAEIAQWPNGAYPLPATPTKKPVDVEGRPVSPPRRRPDAGPNDKTVEFEMPVSSRLRGIVYVGRELGLPYASVAAVFAIIVWLGVVILQPQNEQSIKNQEAIQANARVQAETNAKWAAIVELQLNTNARDNARILPILETLTVEFRNVQQEVRGLRNDLRESKKQ